MENTDPDLPAANSWALPASTCATSRTCPTCGAAADVPPATAPLIYALGRVEARFPRLSVEKEYAQITRRSDTAGLTDRQVLHSVLSKPENRYLARQCCWLFKIGGLETYILVPREPGDLGLIVDALRPAPSPSDVDAVVGVRGPVAPPDVCNGLQVPIVTVDQLYLFDRESLIKSIPRPERVAADRFQATAQELFDRIIQLVDNTGATSGHRALNYLALRYPAIYVHTAERFGENFSLTSVDVRSSPFTGGREMVDVTFTYTNRATDVNDKFFCRVDVTDQFPFLVTKLSPYLDRSGL